MPRIQINRIEASQVDTYGRCLYPGELMLIRGENRTRDLLIYGVNEFDDIETKPTGNGAKTIVTGQSTLQTDGRYALDIYNINSIWSASSNNSAIQFTRLADNTPITLFPAAVSASFAKRPIISGPTSDFMGHEKKDDIALVSDLTKIGPDYANAVNIGFTQLSGTTPQTYTAPSSGYAIIYSAGGIGGNLRVDINGIVYFVAAAGQVFSHTIPLSTGDILSVFQDAGTTTSWNFGVARFAPLKLNT